MYEWNYIFKRHFSVFSIWVHRENFSAIVFIVFFHFTGIMIQFHISVKRLNIANILFAKFFIIAFFLNIKDIYSYSRMCSFVSVASTESYINRKLLEQFNKVVQWKQFHHLNWFILEIKKWLDLHVTSREKKTEVNSVRTLTW